MPAAGDREQSRAEEQADGCRGGNGRDDLPELAACRAGSGAGFPPDRGVSARARRLRAPSRSGGFRKRGRGRGLAGVQGETQAGVEDEIGKGAVMTKFRLVIAGALLATATAASAAEYPSRPMRFVVGFPAGGGLDISCRFWGQKLTARTGQQVIVDNRPGA